MNTPVADAREINELLARYGVKFGIYKHGTFKEQLFPFDAIPRIITAEDFADIEKGLVQRVDALNMFLKDIYSEGKIIKDGIVPEDFVYISKGYLAPCAGVAPPKGIYSHISGIDLVQAKDGTWYILEDNLRIPSGASYPLIARELCRMTSPEVFENSRIADNRNYASLLRSTMDYVNCGGINVILTPGRYNAAYFEHSYLAEKTGAVLVQNTDLFVEDNILYMKDYRGGKTRVGAVYRRISDEYLDPLTFLPESLIGVPHIMDAYRAGNVAIINAPGNGVADDKGIYYFVPKMIKYYLGEEPILKNAPTYLPFYEEDRKYVLDNLEKLVVKDVSEAGGYGVVFGRDMTKEQLSDWRKLITEQSRRFIAQEVIDFIDLEVAENGETVMRKADLRAFVLSGDKTRVWASGLTRFSRQADSFVVNSSQGGGFKDTWVLLPE
ncbi:MAG: circularly permuted type 2 ATP-grasp protein [Oscillospiraceae bacterium]|nr:circularly permuted type 2 ATP-grasp protein [Oscillospiraceae bacterium]MDY3793263.1 circularly permuted type 2 ATP-grasp protein [Oscillospiraceae bacterium]MDY6209203.1 circularly permuted type 2 ATP-grasp protein [Oscillospiraceae bacterium]